MKKIISILFISTLLLVGCSAKETVKEVAPVKTEVKQIKADGIETGKGKIELVNESANSTDGQVVIFAAKDLQVTQIGLNTTDLDGAKLSYVYIDGVLNSKEQLGNAQATLSLKGDALKVSKHKVELAQYDTDKEDGKISTYKAANYEVKSK